MGTKTIDGPAHTRIARHVIESTDQPLSATYTTLDNISNIIGGISNLSYQEMNDILTALGPIRWEHYLLNYLFKTILQMRAEYTGPRPAKDEAQA